MHSACRGALQDISNIPGRQVKKISIKSPSHACEVDCREIESPPSFGLFDLSINRDINEHSPILGVAIKSKGNFEVQYYMCFIYFLP